MWRQGAYRRPEPTRGGRAWAALGPNPTAVAHTGRALGWVGIDPTNDKLVDWQYVRVAVGRDYTDVQPLRGVFVGSQEQCLEVEVNVKRIG